MVTLTRRPELRSFGKHRTSPLHCPKSNDLILLVRDPRRRSFVHKESNFVQCGLRLGRYSLDGVGFHQKKQAAPRNKEKAMLNGGISLVAILQAR